MPRSPDRWLIYRAALSEAGRDVASRIRGLGPSRSPVPDRLLFAPHDLRTADPIAGEDIAAGLFGFAGRTVQTGGNSPFVVIPPSAGWAEALYGFAWLRHLRAADPSLAQGSARALVSEAVGPRRRELRRGSGRRTEVVARRLISFLSHSPYLLEEADHAFYLDYLRAIGEATGQLRRDMNRAARPRARLAAAVGVTYAGLSCAGLERPLMRAVRVLTRELDAQILPDGAPLSRNPADLIDLLLDLMPLRLLFETRQLEPPFALDRALDRMLPMLRFFRHGDGAIALFNGMGRTPFDAIATILSHDGVRGEPPKAAQPSGYQRLEAGDALVIVDAGTPPPLPASAQAHAGCLSFEFSHGANRIVVNCGAPPLDGPLRDASRRMAAHSTLTVGDASPGTIFETAGGHLRGRAAGFLFERLGPILIGGAGRVDVARRVEDGREHVAATHDGYASRFGLLHERHLRLAPDGLLLEGTDTLRRNRAAEAGRRTAAIRFHLAPTARAIPGEDGDIRIALADGTVWSFAAEGAEPLLDDSVTFAVPEGRRAATQIVVMVEVPPEAAEVTVGWRFHRLATATG